VFSLKPHELPNRIYLFSFLFLLLSSSSSLAQEQDPLSKELDLFKEEVYNSIFEVDEKKALNQFKQAYRLLEKAQKSEQPLR